MRCTMNCLVQRQLIIALIWGHMHTELTLNPILSANGKVHFRVDLINIARLNGQSGEHHCEWPTHHLYVRALDPHTYKQLYCLVETIEFIFDVRSNHIKH